MATRIIGTGSYLPETVIDNKVLEKMVNTSDEWIRERVGIVERHIATEETTSAMATKAAMAAIENAGIDVKEIDLIIVATLSPERATPSMSCIVQGNIGASNAMCFDVNAACSGFVYALHIANGLIAAKMHKTVLVIGTETLSKMVDWKDRNTCILFADGAGAAIVREDEIGILHEIMHSDGSKGMSLKCKERSTRNFLVKKAEDKHFIQMIGPDIMKFAVRKVPACISLLLEEAEFDINDVKYFVLHQANARIISLVANKLGVDESKFPMNLDHCGNTSSASIPILLDELNLEGKLQRGDWIVLCGFGGGLTWGATLMQW